MCKIEEKSIELAEAVLEWAKHDHFVAENGWVGGVDEMWDNAKAKMVSIARDISDKRKEEKC